MAMTGGFSWIDVLKSDDTKDNKRPRDWEREWGKAGWSKDIIERFRNREKDKAEEIKTIGTLMADLVEEHKAIVDKCCRNTKAFYMRILLSNKIWNERTQIHNREGEDSVFQQLISDGSLITEERLKEKIMNMSCTIFYSHLMEVSKEAKLSPRMFDINYANFPIWKKNWNADRHLSRMDITDYERIKLLTAPRDIAIENTAKASAITYWINCLSEHNEFKDIPLRLNIKPLPKSEYDNYGAAAA